MSDWTGMLPAITCPDAIEWTRTQPDLATAWARCERGDWMLWLAGEWSGPPESTGRKTLVLAACACARLALPYVPVDDERPLRMIETAERWARGEMGVTLDDMRIATADGAIANAAASYAAYSSSFAIAYAAAGAAAAYAAAAAYIVHAAYAADAAAAAAYAAYVAYADDIVQRYITLARCADGVRRYYPKPPIPQ